MIALPYSYPICQNSAKFMSCTFEDVNSYSQVLKTRSCENKTFPKFILMNTVDEIFKNNIIIYGIFMTLKM